MEFHKKWIYKALTWRVSMMLLGGGIVHLTTGQWKFAALFVAVHTPLSIAWYIGHEKLWHMWESREDNSV